MNNLNQKIESSDVFARLKPYNPKAGQPHKDYTLAHLNMRFIAGRFIKLPAKIASKLARYLEQIHPEEDYTKPPAFQVVDGKTMQNILAQEAKARAQEARAQALGIPLDTLRRLEREAKSSGYAVSDTDLGFETKGVSVKTEQEELADALGVSENKATPVSDEAMASIILESDEDENADGSADEDLWADIQDELPTNEPPQTPEDIQELLSGPAPQNSKGR